MNLETAEEIDAAVVGSFEDEAVSRSVAERAGLTALLRYLDDHPEVNTVVIPQWDRLVGGLAQHTSIVNRLRHGGLSLYTYDGEIDYTDDDTLTELERRSLSSVEEVRRARKRVRRALRSKVRKGLYASRPPFGLRMKPVIGADGTPVPDGQVMLDEKGRPVRSGELDLDRTLYGVGADARPAFEWLQYIFEATADDVPYAQVAARLRANGVRTKSGLIRWDATALGRIIERETYLGAYAWGVTRVVHDEYNDRKYAEHREAGSRDTIRTTTSLGPVIARDVWERANAVRADRVRRKLRGRPAAEQFTRKHAVRVGADLVICGRCGMRMYPRMEYTKTKNAGTSGAPAAPVKWRYECVGKRKGAAGLPHAAHGHPQCTRSHSVTESAILSALRDQVAVNSKYAPSFVTARVIASDNDAAIDQARASITAARARIVRVRDMFVEGDIDRDDMRRRVDVQEGVITAAHASIEALSQTQTLALAVPTPVRRQVVSALRALLADADREWPDVEETQAHREQVTAHLRTLIASVEVDSPTIRVHLRAPSGADDDVRTARV